MKHRFATLDAMRGLAAIAVVLFHLGQVKLAAGLAPHGYLAVDFFFILSGFVIAYTYEAPLASGAMTVPRFLVRRAVRLYPMAVLGVCMAAAVMCLKLRIDPTRVDTPARLAAGVAANLLLLPDPFAGPALKGVLFPGNGVLWSVCLEVGINVFWCLLLVRLGTARLMLVIAASLIVFVQAILLAGTANLGFDWASLPAGLARIGYGFGLGLLMARYRLRLALIRSTGCKLVGIALLAAILLSPTIPALGAGFDVMAIVVLLPAAVLLGLNSADHGAIDSRLGEASYPLYAIHFPILLIASGLHQKHPAVGMGPLLAGVAATLFATTMVALVAYDRPVRRALAGLSRKRERRAPAWRPWSDVPSRP